MDLKTQPNRVPMRVDAGALQARIDELEAANRQLEHELRDMRRERDQLQALNTQRRALLEAIPDLMFRMGYDGVYRDYKADVSDLAIPPEAIVGTDIRNSPLPAAVVEQALYAINTALETDTLQVMHYTLALPEKGERHYEGRIVPSGPDEVLCIIRDQTEQVLTEAELRESRTFAERVTNAVPSILYIFDLSEQRNVFVNRSVGSLLGYTREQIMAMGDELLPSLMHPSDVPLVTDHFARLAALEDGEHQSVEYRMRTHDEQWCWILSIDRIYKRLPDGMPSQIVGTAQDITERRRMEEALQRKTAEFEAIYRSIPDAVIYADSERRIQLVNPAFVEIFGYTLEEVKGQTTAMLYTSEEAYLEKGRERFNLSAKEQRKPYEVAYRRKDGTTFISETVGIPVADSTGHILGFLGLIRDVTEQKKAEQALHESQQFVQLINDTLPDIVYVFDVVAQKSIYSNPAVERVLGFSSEEVKEIGDQWIATRLHPDDYEVVGIHQAKVAALADGASCAVEYRLRHKDGTWRWVLSTDTVMKRLADGSVHHVLGTAQDITERKQAEDAVRASEQRYRSLYNNTPVMLHSINTAGQIVNMSDYWLEKTGYAREDVIGQPFHVFLTAGSKGYFIDETLPAFLEQGQCSDIPYTLVCKDGNHMHVLLSAIAERDETGTLQRSLAVMVDVTERKRAVDALEASKERYRSLYNHTPVMLHSIDAEGRLVSVSDYWLEKMGYTRAEVLGQRSSMFLTEASQVYAVEEVLPAFMRDGYCLDIPYQFVTRSGEVMDVLLSAISERNVQGQVERSLAVVIDVTERKKAEAEREQYARELEGTNKELEQFAYVASHDLQEPLRTITSFIKLLEQDYGSSLSADSKDYFDFIVDAAERMRQLIQDLLTYSRAGQWALNRTATDLNAIVEHVQMGLQVAVHEHKADITVEDLPVLNVDPMLLQLLFQNLLSNAIKFRGSEPPRIEVRAEQRGDLWQFSVHDNGIGIKERYASKIFEIFRRLHGQGKYKGTGIGLAICKKVVERHGGTIWVKSVVGQGSTFYFTLPV